MIDDLIRGSNKKYVNTIIEIQQPIRVIKDLKPLQISPKIRDSLLQHLYLNEDQLLYPTTLINYKMITKIKKNR